jgi:thioester reductase-like protein
MDALMDTITNIFSLLPSQHISDHDANYFQAGVDSLQVVSASRVLRATLTASGRHISEEKLSTSAIYRNPTPRKLAKYIYSLLFATVDESDDQCQEITEMMRQLAKYTLDLPISKTDKPPPAYQSQVVILTGSTGSLGSQLLDLLCGCVNVRKVVCLNRAPDGFERQKAMSSTRGLATQFDKAVFLQVDLGKPALGLEFEVYKTLQREVDRIIHCQWPVNFNVTTEYFEPHVRGVRHLVDFSAGAEKRAPIIFISSIGSVDQWKLKPVVPEECIDDLDAASNGYGRSKLISGLLLGEAARVSSVPSAIIRVGQIAGSESGKGVWNKQEWLPSIVASSVYMGILPLDLGTMQTIDWIPVEHIANIILDISGITSDMPIEKISGYFHGVNPSTTTWTALAPAVREFYADRITRLVPFSEWVDALEKSQGSTVDVAENPAVKLLSTYKGMMTGGTDQRHVCLDMTRTSEFSRSVRETKAISPQLMKLWCEHWQF